MNFEETKSDDPGVTIYAKNKYDKFKKYYLCLKDIEETEGAEETSNLVFSSKSEDTTVIEFKIKKNSENKVKFEEKGETKNFLRYSTSNNIAKLSDESSGLNLFHLNLIEEFCYHKKYNFTRSYSCLY